MRTLHQNLMVVISLAAPLQALAVCDATQPSRTPTSRYEIRGGEVYDAKTDLTWQRCSLGQQWKEAAGCVGLVRELTRDEASGLAPEGWRLPTRDELATLISPTCTNPAINEEAFPDLDLGKLWYWTSSDNGEYLAWLANFADGRLTSYEQSDIAAARFVRSGS